MASSDLPYRELVLRNHVFQCDSPSVALCLLDESEILSKMEREELFFIVYRKITEGEFIK